jgi:hypothetical protein
MREYSAVFWRILFRIVRVGGWVGVESKLGPPGTPATEWPTVSAPGDYDDAEFGGMKIGRGNRSQPQIPLAQTRVWTRAAAVGSQRLTALAMARPRILFSSTILN